MPLLMLLMPQRTGDMIQTLVTEYRDSGWLPTPNSFGNSHSEGMIGDPPAIVIADAYIKGITNFDLESAYAGLRKNATAPPRNIIPMIGAGRGRWAIMPYQRRGYVPANRALEIEMHYGVPARDMVDPSLLHIAALITS